MKPEDLGSSSWPVDLATSCLQSLPDVLGIDLVQRKQGPIPARATKYESSRDCVLRAAATSTNVSREKLSAITDNAVNIHRRAINMTPLSLVGRGQRSGGSENPRLLAAPAALPTTDCRLSTLITCLCR
jgi:hypothetical protein